MFNVRFLNYFHIHAKLKFDGLYAFMKCFIIKRPVFNRFYSSVMSLLKNFKEADPVFLLKNNTIAKRFLTLCNWPNSSLFAKVHENLLFWGTISKFRNIYYKIKNMKLSFFRTSKQMD